MSEDRLAQLKFELDKRRLQLEEKRHDENRINEQKRLELEIGKLRHTEKFDERRLLIEEVKSEREGSFFYRNSGFIISASVALLAAVGGIANVVATHMNNKSQAEIVDKNNQRQKEEAELERNRRWRLEALKFVTENRATLFSGTDEEKERLKGVLEVTFPADIASLVYAGLEREAKGSKEKDFWVTAQKEAERRLDESIKGTAVPGDKYGITELVSQLGGANRKEASDRLIELYKKDRVFVVATLIESLRPEASENSYRHNLYVLVTLGKIPGKWLGTKAQVQAIKEIEYTQPRNYNDSTFKRWAKAAAENAKTEDGVLPMVLCKNARPTDETINKIKDVDQARKECREIIMNIPANYKSYPGKYFYKQDSIVVKSGQTIDGRELWCKCDL
jgi:hypothetical protein